MKSSLTTSTIDGVLKNQHEACTRLEPFVTREWLNHRTPCRNMHSLQSSSNTCCMGLGTIASLRIDDVVSSTTVNCSATVRRGQTKFASQVPTAPLATRSIATSRVKNKTIPACPLLPRVLLRALPHDWPCLCSGVVLVHP